ncbi:MAG: hypothetical protein IPI67_12120 [Myxococcales bacterium]|nr:hypothetical protein [Myxococcales bacterium]
MRFIPWCGALSVCLLPRVAAAQAEPAPSTDAPPEEATKPEPAAKAEAAPSGEAAAPAETKSETKESAPAAADASKEKASENDTSYGHGRQFGVRGGVVGGYRMVFRYDKSPFCNDPDPKKAVKDQQKFCGHAAPIATEVAVSFAPIDGIEPFLFGRFGLQREARTDTDALMMFGAGLRVYTMSDSAFKIFIEPAVGAELEGGGSDPLWKANNPEYKQDVVFHLAAGPQYDFAKMIGVYLDGGITTGILRSIHSNLELQAGLQLRIP